MLEGLTFFPDNASTIADRVDGLFWYLTGVSAFFVTLIALLLLRCLVKYRRRHADERGAAVHGSLALETLWTLVPFALALVAFFWGASIYASMQRPPEDAMEVFVVGRQWMWKLQHMEGRREINTLHVPVGRPVKLTMTSEDVIHSFFVPAFRMKQDALPGRYTTAWFEATKPGTYHLFCTEYCGTLHSGMIGHVVAMEQAAFQEWLAGREGDALPPATAGERVFVQYGCGSCHRADATGRGPTLQGLAGGRVILEGGGTATADDGYLRESILSPQAKIVAGFEAIMPPYEGLLSEEQVLALVAYIKSLTPRATPPGPGAPAAEGGGRER
jgi:cytochrome c oxidase subunit 2